VGAEHRAAELERKQQDARVADLEGINADLQRLNAELQRLTEGLDEELVNIAEVADGAIVKESRKTDGRRSLPPGLAYGAVRTQLKVAAAEVAMLRRHAELQFGEGKKSRDVEVQFLNGQIGKLEAALEEANEKIALIQVKYVEAELQRDKLQVLVEVVRGEVADSREATKIEKARASDLERELGLRTKELEDANRSHEEAVHAFAKLKREILQGYGTRRGRIARKLGLSAPVPEALNWLDRDSRQPLRETPKQNEIFAETKLAEVKHVNDLLSLNGSHFVEAIYRVLLKRSPDRAGREHFLGRLQAGHGKEAIILAVANSPEAKAIGHQLDGLADLSRANSNLARVLNRRDRLLELRFNRLEYVIGETQNTYFARLDKLQSSIDQIQAALMHRGSGIAANMDRTNSRPTPSIKQGVALNASTSPAELVEELGQKVRSTSEAQSLRKN
jgi:hypothetical protein